jgi:hypothetical protein
VPSILLSLLPVFLFLTALIVLDSYKLVTFRAVGVTIGIGCVIAVCAFLLNTVIFDFLGVDRGLYSRYGAPIVEESDRKSVV